MSNHARIPTLCIYPPRPNSSRQHCIELGGLDLCRRSECESGVRICEVSKLQSSVSDFVSYKIKAFENYIFSPSSPKKREGLVRLYNISVCTNIGIQPYMPNTLTDYSGSRKKPGRLTARSHPLSLLRRRLFSSFLVLFLLSFNSRSIAHLSLIKHAVPKWKSLKLEMSIAVPCMIWYTGTWRMESQCCLQEAWACLPLQPAFSPEKEKDGSKGRLHMQGHGNE